MSVNRTALITLKLLITASLAARVGSKVTAPFSPTNDADGEVIGSSGGVTTNNSVGKESPSSTAADVSTHSLMLTRAASHSPQFVPTIKDIDLADIKSAGYFLLPVSLLFTIVNGFLVALVCVNWDQITSSAHYNSSLLCLLLTLSDLALSGLLGLPIGIRFTFEEQLRNNKALVFYTEDMGFLIFEYLLIFRMLIIAVQSVDRCLNIMMISRYLTVVTKWRIHVLCVITATLPLLRILPVAYVLCANLATVHCLYYGHSKNGTAFYTPLTCMIDSPRHVLPNFDLAEIIVIGTITTVTWLVIVVSNTVLLIKVFRRAFQVYNTVEDRAELNKELINSCALMVLIAFSFALTNFPFFAVWAAVYVYQQHVDTLFANNYKLQFYLILLTFLSLFFHPWLYILRVRSIRELVIGLKTKAQRFAPTTLSRISTSYQDMRTLADTELECQDQETGI